mmetsp:Transcript_10238/g.21683  ORF Transcript_10238/g.21683 Transcript_10238/m.21683 type:complete len:128 (-) Transcript_10238:23-406(-)
MPSGGGGGGVAIQIVSTHNVIFPACPAAEEEGEHRTHLVGGITTGRMYSQGNWREMVCCGGPSVSPLSADEGNAYRFVLELRAQAVIPYQPPSHRRRIHLLYNEVISFSNNPQIFLNYMKVSILLAA